MGSLALQGPLLVSTLRTPFELNFSPASRPIQARRI